MVCGAVPPQVQDFVLVCVELHEVSACPVLQPIQVQAILCYSSRTLWHLSYSPQLCINHRLAEDPL